MLVCSSCVEFYATTSGDPREGFILVPITFDYAKELFGLSQLEAALGIAQIKLEVALGRRNRKPAIIHLDLRHH